MIESHLSNPFANSTLGNGRFGKYAAEHLARVQAAELPGAEVAARVAATTTALDAFTSGRKVGAVASAGREGKTITLDKAIQRLQKFVSVQAPVLAALFTDFDKDIKGIDSAEYQAFFPQGVRAITEANKAEIEAAFAPFVKAAEIYKAKIGGDVLTKATDLLTDVQNARAAQLEGKGATKDAQTDRNAARAALALELFRNLLTLLLHHAAEPKRARDYFNQAILKENTGYQAPPSSGPQ